MRVPHSAFDIVIIGGGLSALAAAQLACTAGARVCIVEPSRWLGGQITSQGVSALDEHRFMETWPGNTQYARLRAMLRQQMALLYGITPSTWTAFNPGNAWVSNLCFFPTVAASVIDDFIAPYIESGLLTIYYNAVLESVTQHAGVIETLTITSAAYGRITLSTQLVIDASDAGDVLACSGLAYVTGAESRHDTGEHDAPLEAQPTEVQSFTFGFAVEYCPGAHHRIAKPEGYEELRDRQPFSLTIYGQDGAPRPFRMFSDGPTGLPPFWTYRRLWDGQHTVPATPDIALINWNSNDYHFGRIIDEPDQVIRATLDEARRLSLAFLYWLQTEVPRDDGGYGYPEFKLRPDIMGSADGLSLVPYVRESRRSRGIHRIIADDILADVHSTARARHMPDSVGVGWYPMDLHPAPGNMRSMFAATRPFQIPMGALIPPDCHNLLLANKTIATTHLSNGAYRLHPIEWQIGTACAAIALESLKTTRAPHALYEVIAHQEAIQARLLHAGQSLAWTTDIAHNHPLFHVTQWLVLWGVIADGDRAQRLEIDPTAPLSPSEFARVCALVHTRQFPVVLTETMTWEMIGHVLSPYIPR